MSPRFGFAPTTQHETEETEQKHRNIETKEEKDTIGKQGKNRSQETTQ
jgi:hypothetical protein